MDEITLLRKLADEAKIAWDKGWLTIEAISLKNLLTDRIDFNERHPTIEADTGKWCLYCNPKHPTRIGDDHCPKCGREFHSTKEG